LPKPQADQEKMRYSRGAMHRAVKQWLGVGLFVGGAAGVLFLRRSPADLIREDLESAAGALQFDGHPLGPSWVAALKANLARHLSDPVTIDLGSLGESNYSAEQLFEGIHEYASNLNALHLTLHHIGVKLDSESQRATAKGDAYLNVVTTDAQRRGEPRKFAATLEKRAQGWVVLHLRISAPKIDQPEARP
jgi:hypothetical protein